MISEARPTFFFVGSYSDPLKSSRIAVAVGWSQLSAKIDELCLLSRSGVERDIENVSI